MASSARDKAVLAVTLPHQVFSDASKGMCCGRKDMDYYSERLRVKASMFIISRVTLS